MASISAACTAAILLVGCSGTASWEGSWHGRRELSGIKEITPASRTLGEVRLNINPRQQFTLVDASMPKAGTYRIKDGVLLLQVEEVAGRPLAASGDLKLNPEIALERQPDGSLLFKDPAAFDKKPIRLVRETQPAR